MISKRNKFFSYTHLTLFIELVICAVALGGCGDSPNICQLDNSPPTMSRTLKGGLVVRVGNHIGTLGTMVHDRATGRPMVLTNCHVATRDSQCDDNPSWNADELVGPGPESRAIGTGVRGMWNGSSLGYDWAVVNVDYPGWDYNTEIIERGKISGVWNQALSVNQRLAQFDRTASGTVKFARIGPDFKLRAETPGEIFSSDGNSGSIIVDDATNQAVGLATSVDKAVTPETYSFDSVRDSIRSASGRCKILRSRQ